MTASTTSLSFGAEHRILLGYCARRPVSSKRPEDLTVHRLKHLPIKEAGDSLRAQRADLEKLVVRALVAEPGFPGKPVSRAQYEDAGVTSSDLPPIHGRAFDDLLLRAEPPVFPRRTAEQRTHLPREREAVPAIAPADAPEIDIEAC